MSKETTTVKILGASYKIACPPKESEEVKKAAIFLDNKLSEVKEASGQMLLLPHSVYYLKILQLFLLLLILLEDRLFYNLLLEFLQL